MRVKYTFLTIIGLALALLVPFYSSYAVPDPVEEAAKAYGLAKGAEALTNLPAATRAIESAGGTLPYQGGNNTFSIAANMAEDYLKHIEDFHWPNPLGRDWAWDGICIRWTWRGPRFTNLIRYRYPMLMAEQSTLFRGEYVPDVLMTLYADFYDNFYDKVADNEAGREIKRTQSIMAGSWSPLPAGGGPGMNKSTLTSAPESFRKRGGIQSAGARGLNYHLFLTTAGLLNFPRALWGNCHQRPPPITLPGVLHSNNPLFLDFTHLNMWSDMLFMPQMAALYNSPTADFPVANTCIIHNIATGRSPSSTLAGVVADPALGVSKPRALCVESLGARFPITTRLHNVRSPYNAARLSFLRSIAFFRAFPLTPMIDFAYFRAGTEREDHVQFHHPPVLSSEIGSIRRDTNFTQSGYVGGNYESDPDRTVLTVWKWVRCCRRGRPWIVWSGNRTQYRGMHQFSGGRYP